MGGRVELARAVLVGPDGVSLQRIVNCKSTFDVHPAQLITRDHIASAVVRSADHVVRTVHDVDPKTVVCSEVESGEIETDDVSLNRGLAGRVEYDARAGVPGDHVAGASGSAAN